MEKYILSNKLSAIHAFKSFQTEVKGKNILEINGNVPVLNVPGILNKSTIESISSDCKKMLDIIIKITDYHISQNSDFFKLLGLNEDEVEIFRLTYGDNKHLMSRCDLMIDPVSNNYKFLEFNVDSSVGGIEIAQVNKLMLKYDFYESFFSKDKFYTIDPLDCFCKMLDRIELGAPNEECTIAIIDSDELIDGYLWSLNTFKTAIESYGFNVVIGSFKDLESKNDFLYVKNEKVDVAYRVFLNDDVKSNYSNITPILDAYRKNNLILINGLHTELYSSKYIFSLLHDKTSLSILTSDERETVLRCVPKSLFVRDVNITELEQNKNNFVLKPIDGYGGRGIHMGWNKTQNEWDDILADIVTKDKKYIAQERISYNNDYNYYVEDDKLKRIDCHSTWGVYILIKNFRG